jgi:hypothetical protein
LETAIDLRKVELVTEEIAKINREAAVKAALAREIDDFVTALNQQRDKIGRDALVRYYERYIAIAQADSVGFILESPTWRASSQSRS